MDRGRCFLLVWLLAGCSSEDPCTNTASCPIRMQCVIETPGERGYCAPCDEMETPYDGIDNDCLARTPDVDIDGDGDNWDAAPFDAGTDCDDGDPLVSARFDEVCDDDKDNDCDGETDEPDCADTMAPTVRFTSPAEGALLSGTVDVSISATDDVGVVSVELIGPRGVQLGRKETLPYVFEVDTTALEDGPATLEASATDIVGARSFARLDVVIDNEAGPVVTVLRGPTGGGRFGGTIPLELEAEDPSGVARIDVEVDDIRVASSTGARLFASFDSSGWGDGTHELAIISFDNRGSLRRVPYDVVFDNTPPAITFIRPQDMDVVAPGIVTVEISASDPAGIRRTWIAGNGLPGATQTATVSLQAGLQTITASAADVVVVDGVLSGNVGTNSVTVRVQP